MISKLHVMACAVGLLVGSFARAEEPIQLVNPMVGTSPDGGAMFPGAALPFSMVKLSPDSAKPTTSGYNDTQPILGFSHTHIGGTGGAAFGGQIRLVPQTGDLNVTPAPSKKANETASPGFYSVDLPDAGIRVELTSSERAGFHRYTFPAGAPARVLIDISAAINNRGAEKPSGFCTGSSAKFVSESQVEGSASFQAGDGRMTYTVHFVATSDAPATHRGVWLDQNAKPGELELTGASKQQAGVYAEFAPGATVNVRVGISYTSIELARKNLEATGSLDFDQVRRRSESIWSNHLDTIKIEGGTDAQRRQFYTALYHTVFTPIDVTGDNAKWTDDDTQPVYWDIYTLWDTFRTTDPLRILIYPQRERDIIKSLLAVYQKTGWLPDAWVYNKMGIPFQGGTHADNVIADAVVKKLGGFDVNLAYEAVRKNATDATAKNSKIFPGTGRLSPYFTLGYVPSTVYYRKDAAGKENEWSCGVSRTLEYSYNDFSVSQVAAALGKTEDAEKFRKQSLNAYALFHPEKKLFWGKGANGEWMPDFDPTAHINNWSNAYYEGSAWQYRFSMQHDVQGLIDRLGGDEAFVATLDEYFDKGLHWPGNEPGFLTPWLYIYAGRPDKTVDRVQNILAKNFKLTPKGYPGDEDTGAMSAWYLFASIGFYPNAGQDLYLINAPLFNKSTIKLGDSGKTIVLSAPNVSAENKYVQALMVNGKPWNKAWFQHGDVIDGAELVFEMGPKPSTWGTQTRPPSLSTQTTR